MIRRAGFARWAAAVSELQRVDRDLHDGAQARLVALAMNLGMAEQRLRGADPEAAAEHVASARNQARAAMAEGGTVLDPEVVAQILARRRSTAIDVLTPREPRAAPADDHRAARRAAR